MRNNESICKEVVKKNWKLHLWKKNICFFKHLTPKNDWIFIETKLKSLVFPKILFLVIKSKIQTKNWKKLAKKLRKSDEQMYNFMKQNYIEVERGIEYMNYQREVAILTNIWQKTAKWSKNEEINRKKAKN